MESSTVETAEPRVLVEIETMTKGPAKVTVRITGEDGSGTADEALSLYRRLANEVTEDFRKTTEI